MATSGELSRLRRVRLGQRERQLLLAAPGPEVQEPGKIGGMMPITEPSRAARVAALRAAKRLWELGLVEYVNQRFAMRRVHICLTPLGVAVVERYRRELELGQRIRWPHNEEDR